MSKLLKNSTIYFATDIATKLAMFVLLPLYTKLINPHQFGNIYLLISLSGFLTVLTSLTMNSAISRYYFSKNTHADVVSMYSSIIKFTFWFTTPVFTLLFIFGPDIFGFINLDFYPYTASALAAAYFSTFYICISALLQAKQDAKRLSFITIISSLVNLLVTFVMVMFMNDKVFAYLLSFLITSLVNFSIFLLFSSKYFSFKAKDPDLKKFVTYSVTRMPVDLSSWIVNFANGFMLYEIKGEKETGIYSIGFRIGQAVQILFMAINKAYVPFTFEQFVKAEKTGIQEFKQVASNGIKLFALYFFITFTAIVFSKELVLLLDQSYKDSNWVLAIILFSYLFIALKLLFQPPMDYKIEYTKIKSFLWILTAILNIILNLVLIPLYSINGAALASLISHGVILIPIIYYSNKSVPIKYDIRKIMAICLISVAYLALLLLQVSLLTFLLKMSCTLVYVIVLLRILGIRIICLAKGFKSFKLKI